MVSQAIMKAAVVSYAVRRRREPQVHIIALRPEAGGWIVPPWAKPN